MNNLNTTQGEWTISVQSPCENESGDIFIDKPTVKISAGKDEKWVAILGNPNHKEVQDNARLISAAKALLEAATEAYVFLESDGRVHSREEVKEKLYKAINKATK